MTIFSIETMYDIAIIGAGPAGLFASFEAGMLGLSAVIIDTLPYPGGQCSALYPEKPIYDIPAIPVIKAEDLTQNLLKQNERFKHDMLLSTFVESYTKNSDNTFTLHAIRNKEQIQINTKSIIIAIGGGSFGPNKPPLENIEEYEEKSIFYMVHNKQQFAGKNVIITGGGDSAVDWAILLSDIANVSVVHRRNKFRAHENSLMELNKLFDSKKVRLYTPFQLKSLHGNNGILSHITLENIDNNSTTQVDANFLLPFFGLAMEIGPIKNWGFNFEKNYITVNHSTMQTNIDGIFAIGDIATYKGKLKLILCGFAEATTACYGVRSYLYPNKSFHFEYSTSIF